MRVQPIIAIFRRSSVRLTKKRCSFAVPIPRARGSGVLYKSPFINVFEGFGQEIVFVSGQARPNKAGSITLRHSSVAVMRRWRLASTDKNRFGSSPGESALCDVNTEHAGCEIQMSDAGTQRIRIFRAPANTRYIRAKTNRVDMIYHQKTSNTDGTGDYIVSKP